MNSLLLLITINFQQLINAQCYVHCENVDDDIAEIVEGMDDLGYSVMSGNLELYNPDTSDLHIPFARPDTDYFYSSFAPDGNPDIRIGGQYAIVWRGCTPPEVKYFGYRSYLSSTISDDTSPSKILQSSLGDTINQGVINTESNVDTSFDAPFDRKTNIITTGDEQTYNDLVTVYTERGLLNEFSVNLDAINGGLFTYSDSELDYPRDQITIIYSVQFDPDSPCGGDGEGSYLNQSFPFKVFYKSGESRTPFNVTLRDTSNDAQECETSQTNEAFFETGIYIIRDYVEKTFGYEFLSDTSFTSDSVGVVVGDSDIRANIFEHGIYCNGNQVDCWFDNKDTYYSWPGQDNTLSGDDYYVIVGLNHNNFGLSTINSISLVDIEDSVSGNNFEVIGDITNYGNETYDLISNGIIDCNVNKGCDESLVSRIFAVQVARPENCMNDISLQLCPDTTILADNEPFIFFGEAMLNPTTNTRPDGDCLIDWRLLRFTVPSSDPTKDPTTDPTRDPTTDPTKDPTTDPTKDPTADPTKDPTTDPTSRPTTSKPTQPTPAPTKAYHLFKGGRWTYDEAKLKCEENGMQLPTIFDQSDVDDVMATGIEPGLFEQRVWIGLTDIDQEGVWKWEDGTECKYTDTDENSGLKLCVAANGTPGDAVQWYQPGSKSSNDCANIWQVDAGRNVIEITDYDCTEDGAYAVLCQI